MIVDIATLRDENEIKNISDSALKKKIKAIERIIRKHTNNNFMDVRFRFNGYIKDNIIYTNAYPFLKKNDNIEISYSYNDDVFTVESIVEDRITVDSNSLIDCDNVMITKVVYPEDIQEGVINMLKWDIGLRNKVGIKSETLSRHSVTYFDMDKNNSLNGYPASLLGFLEDYMKARF